MKQIIYVLSNKHPVAIKSNKWIIMILPLTLFWSVEYCLVREISNFEHSTFLLQHRSQYVGTISFFAVFDEEWSWKQFREWKIIRGDPYASKIKHRGCILLNVSVYILFCSCMWNSLCNTLELVSHDFKPNKLEHWHITTTNMYSYIIANS